jgi:hypothetical protein
MAFILKLGMKRVQITKRRRGREEEEDVGGWKGARIGGGGNKGSENV